MEQFELTARIRAALRRRADPQPFVLGDLAIDYDRRQVTVAGRPVALTATEYELLRVLSLNAGRVTTSETLLNRVWAGRGNGDTKVVRAFVKQLRQKLGDDAGEPGPHCLDTSYLVHFLRTKQPHLERLARGATIKGVTRETVANLEIPLPSLPEQLRIAEILDKADALRAKRRAALAQLDTLTQSIFLDMFGDPAVNGWCMTTIDGVAAETDGAIRTGPFGSQLLHSEFTEEGIAVLGIDNAVENEFRWGRRRFINEGKYRQLSRYTVHAGDVLITIMGTCGRCAIVPDDIPRAVNTKHLCCITLDHTKCLPVFLHAYFLQHPIARRYLARKAKGAIMAGLNMGIIRDMPIPRAPIDLQEEFAEIVNAVGSLKRVQRQAETEVKALLASLQHRAFRGEL